MKTYWLLFLLLFLFAAHFSFAQNKAPLVKQWDARFGGLGNDYLTDFHQTSDGGYILGGYSNSGAGNDKSQNSNGTWDYWIVKIDSLGNKQWDKDFGGNLDNELYSLQQTKDGGYILGGYSSSGIGGDKTQSTRGAYDYWIIKIDSLGNKQWDKDFGGNNSDNLRSLQQTKDGGYILGGFSYSIVGGDKTQGTVGSNDYWIVKIDSLGNKQWDKDFGGYSDDDLVSLQQTRDGGYILGGGSNSVAGANKTQFTKGGEDYWIVKTDSLGNKEWDKDFGGSGEDFLYSLQQTRDFGYILSGSSTSGLSGDKTQKSNGGVDYWIIKIDSLGNKQWDKDFGGTDNEDDFGNVFQTTDGNYLVACTSYSPVGGNKTENNLGKEQSWVVKIDSLGNYLWDKTIFTNGHDEAGFVIQSRDGGIVVANITPSDTGGYKTQMGNGGFDYWIVKFSDTSVTCTSTKAGVVSAERDTICPGTIAKLNVAGNSGTIQWQSSLTNSGFINIAGATGSTHDEILSQTTYYRVFAGTGPCTDTSAAFQLVVVPDVFASFNNSNQAFTITFNSDSSTGNISGYYWNFGDGDTSTLPNPVHMYTTIGTYHVCLTVKNNFNCNYTTCQDITIDYPTGLTNLPHQNNPRIYPNPFTSNFYIKISAVNPSIEAIKIYNVLGQLVLRKNFEESPNNVFSVDASGLSEGIYYLSIRTHEQDYIQPVVKQ